MEKTVSFGGDCNIGVFTRVFDDIAVVPPNAPGDFCEALTGLLGVEIVETTIQGSAIIGSLLAGNRHGFVVSGFAEETEIARLSEYRELCLLTHTMNAAGNILLANDSLTLAHPDMPEQMAEEIGVGEITLRDIIKELQKPGRDPRDEMPRPILRTDVLDMKDLKVGMILKGTVRNVIDFGAFVDIGVHQDGLVHISQMTKRFIKHPLEAVSVGDIVEVKRSEEHTSELQSQR